MDQVIVFDNVNVVFGSHPETALPFMDAGQDRAAIQEACGQILGVHNCSLDVATGEILVLMGLSGSGKSTLLRAVNALAPVVRGAVFVNDGDGKMVDVSHSDAVTRRHIRQNRVSMVFQQFGLLPWRSVRKNVELGLELSGVPKAERREQAEAQLALVGLSDWVDRKVSELSGGMQQRVGLARALVSEAPILLMDEPFSALDPLIRIRLQEELLDLQSKLQRTIIFVSHDLDEAFKVGNRVAIMEEGRIVQCGTPKDIVRSPATQYVADFVEHVNPLGLLCAEDVMVKPRRDGYANNFDAKCPVREIMDFCKHHIEPVGVTKDGRIIGEISQGAIIAALLGKGQHDTEPASIVKASSAIG